MYYSLVNNRGHLVLFLCLLPSESSVNMSLVVWSYSSMIRSTNKLHDHQHTKEALESQSSEERVKDDSNIDFSFLFRKVSRPGSTAHFMVPRHFLSHRCHSKHCKNLEYFPQAATAHVHLFVFKNKCPFKVINNEVCDRASFLPLYYSHLCELYFLLIIYGLVFRETGRFCKRWHL